MTSTPLSLAGFPVLVWHEEPAASHYDVESERLSITARAGTDWSNDPLSANRRTSATASLFALPDGDFAVSARVSVGFTGPFDAGVLCLWQNEDQWAKLCFEHSPQGEPTVMSVVTREISDDASAVVIDQGFAYLRLLRSGLAYAFHYSLDGSLWHFVRLFRLGQGTEPMHAGFLVQAPNDTECTSTFEAITFTSDVPADLRDGS